MAKLKVTRNGWRCQRCGYAWVSRSASTTPTVCPKCKSPYWSTPARKSADVGARATSKLTSKELEDIRIAHGAMMKARELAKARSLTPAELNLEEEDENSL